MPRHSRQLMIRQLFPKRLSRSAQSTMKLVIGIFHLIHFVYSSQAAFVECAVVRHQRQTLDFRYDFCPNGGENIGVFGIFKRDSVNVGKFVPIIFGVGANEAVDFFDDLAVAYDNDADGADACAVAVGDFEVDRGEGIHLIKVQKNYSRSKYEGKKVKNLPLFKKRG